MMTFNEEKLVAVLGALEPLQRVAFAASCAGRLLPMCLIFLSNAKSDAEAMVQAHDLVWDSISSSDVESVAVRQSLEMVMKLMSEEADSWTPLHAYAEDGFSALAYALRCLIEQGSAQEAAWSARRVYEALDHFVIYHQDIDVSAPEFELTIMRSTAIQTELARQARDLEELTLMTLPEFVLLSRARCKREPAITTPAEA